MTIPKAIQSLVNQLLQELDQVEQQSSQGLDLARQLLSRFPNNSRLLGITATLINALFLVDNFRKRIQSVVKRIDKTDLSAEVIQEAGEELSEFLGRILECKILVEQAVAILDNLK